MDNPEKKQLIKTAANLPALPGVYLFRDSNGKVIYAGKAKNLKKRVGSYFSRKQFDNNKLRVLVKQIRSIDHIVVDSESDALLLENNLIKEYKPRYNVLLKDDKSYPYICIKNESFPRVFSTRNPVRDGSDWFGPYTSLHMVRTVLEMIRQLYPLRTCNYNLSEVNIKSGKFRVCLEFHIGNCLGPCEGKQQAADYERNISQIRDILKGNIRGVREFLMKRMRLLAGSHAFEDAQLIKEKLDVIEKYQSKSTVVNPAMRDLDVFSFIDAGNIAVSNFLKVVDGAVVQSRTIEIRKVFGEDKADLLALVMAEIRSGQFTPAREVITPFPVNAGFPGVKFTIPRKGDKKKLLDLSTRNAGLYIKEKERRLSEQKREEPSERILKQAKEDLGLDRMPVYIECFDNSNIQGTSPVSACVVFRNGRPSKGEYRHYNINTVKGPDDYASMSEVVGRRYRRLKDEDKDFPDLVVIDGGKAQLGAAMVALRNIGLDEKIRVIAIAKRLEEIFFPGDPVPLYLDKTSSTLRLIQHLRNEAHRFSLMFHRQKRSSVFARSVLESVPGLGKRTVEKLYDHFKNWDAIAAASEVEISAVIGQARARKLAEYMTDREEG
ncbi:MAG: excinuclease ABC subunit UvrC [Marinilabiliales bacterium]|nr:MAG: excinuclease ABC subunit UvrC [Marinilabiliales bacterium]